MTIYKNNPAVFARASCIIGFQQLCQFEYFSQQSEENVSRTYEMKYKVCPNHKLLDTVFSKSI